MPRSTGCVADNKPFATGNHVLRNITCLEARQKLVVNFAPVIEERRMFDWTSETSDPNNSDAIKKANQYLRDVRLIEKCGYVEWLLNIVEGKTCLDVGAVEHDLSYTERDTWKHGQLKKVCSRVVGIDILEEYAAVLRERGYDIRVCDATSDTFLGEKFEAVVLGDVIEHVNNPVDLLRFAIRHLQQGGIAVAKTPNPYYIDHIKKFAKSRGFENLDHIAWFTPTMAMEIARRAGCQLSNYVVFTGDHPRLGRLLRPDLLSRDFVYIFSP